MGSDYTPGVKGIAAVNATEIINCFGSTEADLTRFRQWVDIDNQIKDKIVEHKDRDKIKSEKKIKQEQQYQKELEAAVLDERPEERARSREEIEEEFQQKHKNLRKHWAFPMDFPNFNVIKAYQEPAIDPSLETFSWGDPKFDDIREFAKDKLNWRPKDIQRYIEVTKQRVGELKKKRKGTLENYFGKKEKVSSVKGRRVGQAIIDLKNKRHLKSKDELKLLKK